MMESERDHRMTEGIKDKFCVMRHLDNLNENVVTRRRGVEAVA